MKKCQSIQKSLGWCEGVPTLAGIRGKAFFTAVSNIVKWPTLPLDDLGRPTGAALQGDFELLADASWKYIEFNPDQSQHTSETANEPPNQLQLNKLVLVHPGVDEDATAAMAYVNNTNNVVVFQDMQGRWRVVGANLYRNKSYASQDNGQGPTGSASTTFNFEAYDYIASPFYTGTLVTEDGEISCAPDDEPEEDTPKEPEV